MQGETPPAPGVAVPDSAPPLLHVDPPRLELGWVRGGATRHASTTLEEDDTASLANAARELVAAADIDGQGVVLCLGASAFESRRVALSTAEEAEAYGALSRHAAERLGVGADECLFWAQRCEPPQGSVSTDETSWLVHARRREAHVDLLLRLRRGGVHVRRTVAGWDVVQNALVETAPAAGRILLATTGREVYAQLYRGKELADEHLRPVPRFEKRGETYRRAVQDVRHLARSWAEANPGASLASVSLFGFGEGEVTALRPELAEAVGDDVAIDVLGAPYGSRFSDVREGWVELLMTHAARGHDIGGALPPRPSRVAAAALALAALGGFLGWELCGPAVRSDVGGDALVAAPNGLGAPSSGSERILGGDLPLSAAVDHVRSTLGGGADVRRLELEQRDEGARIVMEAVVAPGDGSAGERLDRIRRAFDSDGAFRDVVFGSVDDEGGGRVLTLSGLYAGSGT